MLTAVHLSQYIFSASLFFPFRPNPEDQLVLVDDGNVTQYARSSLNHTQFLSSIFRCTVFYEYRFSFSFFVVSTAKEKHFPPYFACTAVFFFAKPISYFVDLYFGLKIFIHSSL